MNAARNLVIDFRINGKHDHYINRSEDKSVQPHRCKKNATKKRHK